MRLKIILLTISAVLVLSSCDENKSKAKDIAKQFANAVNAHDKATIIELFPDSKDMPNMSLANNIDVKSLEVQYTDSLKYYEVFYGNEQKQSIVIREDSLGVFRIIDTQHIYSLDSVVYELALKTGVPINKLSDIHLCDLMREGSGLINGISSTQTLDDLLSVEGYSFDCERYDIYPTLYTIIKNNSKTTIKGEDYKIEIFLYYQHTNINYLTLVAEGKDIGPSNRERIQILCDGIGDTGDISYNTYVKYRFVNNNMSIYEQLLKYGNLNGGEYNFYLEINEKIDDNEKKIDEMIKLVSKQKLTNDDLKNLMPMYLRLLRNSIYAKHGYIFGDKTIANYFEEKSWYKGITTDMNKVSAEFNEMEKYNVKFIKDFEKDK